MQRVRKQGIAEQHRRVRTEFAGGRPPVPAKVGFIHDIVMDQRREMDQLNHGRDPDEFRLDGAALPAAQEDQGGPNPFARGVDAIVRHRPDLRLEGAQLRAQKPIEFAQVRRQPREHPGERVRGHRRDA